MPSGTSQSTTWHSDKLVHGYAKARTIPVIFINTNRYNVWIRQPLLAAKLFDAECDEIEYRANMNQDGDNISVGFEPVPPQLINTNSCQVEAGPIQLDSPEIEKPEFGPRLDTNSTEFNIKKELEPTSFPIKHWERSQIYGRPTGPIH